MPKPDDTSALAAFQRKYGVTFTREIFTRSQPNERGAFELKPDDVGKVRGPEPLPPIGCRIKVYGYGGNNQSWQTVVTSVDKERGTYVATIVRNGSKGGG